jgi:ATP adenylyltransferase
METLWSSWRSKYIEGFKDSKNDEECFICKAVEDIEGSKDRLVVARFEHCLAIMNRYPYNAGHLLIAPNRHIGNLSDLNDKEMLEIFQVQQKAIIVFDKVMKPQGYNIGANLGRIAGAGLPGHIHFHIVPRWSGDSNFMPVLADTKIISQSLEDLQVNLSIEFSKI